MCTILPWGNVAYDTVLEECGVRYCPGGMVYDTALGECGVRYCPGGAVVYDTTLNPRTNIHIHTPILTCPAFNCFYGFTFCPVMPCPVCSEITCAHLTHVLRCPVQCCLQLSYAVLSCLLFSCPVVAFPVRTTLEFSTKKHKTSYSIAKIHAFKIKT